MNDDLTLVAKFVLDIEDAKKQVEELHKLVASGGSNGKSSSTASIVSSKDVDNAKQVATQLAAAQAQFRSLLSSQQTFLTQGSKSKDTVALVTAEMADQVKIIRELTQDQQDRNTLLQKEVELRQQAAEATKATKPPSSNTSGGSGSGGGGGGNPLSQIPGFNQANNMLGGGMSTAAGGVFGIAIGGTVAALKAFGDTVAEAGKKAQEFAKNFSDAGGGMDKLRQSQLNQNYADSKLAHNPVVLDMEKAKNDWDASWKKFVDTSLKQIKDAAQEAPAMGDMNKLTKIRKDRDDAEEKAMATPGQMVASDKIQYDQLKRQGVEMEQDIAREKVKMDHDFMKQHRDLLMEEKEERINYDNQVYDNQLQKTRATRDFQHNMSVLNADVEFKASNQKYDLERQAEKRNFELKQGDERQLAAFSKQDRQQQAAFAKQDRQHQLNTTLGRGAEDFNEDLVKMGISGASGTDYLFKAMDYSKQRRRTIQDSQYEGYKANRNLAFQNFTADRDLNFKQGTERRDFNLGQGDKAKEHSIDLATHQYQLDQARYQLTTSYNDAMQDNAESLRRLTVQQKLTEEKFKNRENDLAFDEKTTRQDFDINNTRQRRSLNESKQEFAANLYSKDPYGFDKIEQGNDELGSDLAGYLQRAGLPGYTNRAKLELQQFQKDRHTPAQGLPANTQSGADHYDNADYYNNQWDGSQAADGMPVVPEDKLVKVHKDEAILTVPQAHQWRKQQTSLNNGGQRPHFAGYDDHGPIAGYGSRPHFAGYDDHGPIRGYDDHPHFAGYDDQGPIAGYGSGPNNLNPTALGRPGLNVGDNPAPIQPTPAQQWANNQPSQNQPNINNQFSFPVNGDIGNMPDEMQKGLLDVQRFADQRMANAKQDAISANFKLQQRLVFGSGGR